MPANPDCVKLSPDELQSVDTTLTVTVSLMFILYGLLLYLLSYNSYKVLYLQEKWKQLPMISFYCLSFVIIVMRLLFFSFIFSTALSSDRDRNLFDMKTQNTIDQITTYLELMLGLQQLFQMIELYLKLQFAVTTEKILVRQQQQALNYQHRGTQISTKTNQESQKEINEIGSRCYNMQKWQQIVQIASYIGVFAIGLLLTTLVSDYEVKETTIAQVRDEPTIEHQYEIVTLSFFAFVGLIMLIALTMLIKVIKANFGDIFRREMRSLIVCQMIFVTTFLIRVCLISLVISNKWIKFGRDYGCIANAFFFAVFVLEFIPYNILPIGVISYLHWKNFRQEYDPIENATCSQQNLDNNDWSMTEYQRDQSLVSGASAQPLLEQSKETNQGKPNKQSSQIVQLTCLRSNESGSVPNQSAGLLSPSQGSNDKEEVKFTYDSQPDRVLLENNRGEQLPNTKSPSSYNQLRNDLHMSFGVVPGPKRKSYHFNAKKMSP